MIAVIGTPIPKEAQKWMAATRRKVARPPLTAAQKRALAAADRLIVKEKRKLAEETLKSIRPLPPDQARAAKARMKRRLAALEQKEKPRFIQKAEMQLRLWRHQFDIALARGRMVNEGNRQALEKYWNNYPSKLGYR